MKQLFLVIFITAIIIISGSTYVDASRNPVPNPELLGSLVEKAQNNSDTHSFEGFTGKTTIRDIPAMIGPDKFTGAEIYASTELLGYPAALKYEFSSLRGGIQRLNNMDYTIYPRGQENRQEAQADLLAKLDEGLGTHIGSGSNCIWVSDEQQTVIWFFEEGALAHIISHVPGHNLYSFSGTPDLFPCRLGEDVGTVFGSITPCALPEGAEALQNSVLQWKDEGISAYMMFKTDEKGLVKPIRAIYCITLNDMGFEESLGFYESLANGLETAMGAPYARGYGIPRVTEDAGKITGMGYTAGNGGQGLSAEDISDSGKKYYWFEMNWPGVNLSATYGRGASSSAKKETDITVNFYEEYFNPANE